MSKRKHKSKPLPHSESGSRTGKLGVVGLIVGLLGLLGLITLWPRPTMESGDSLNATDPFTTAFVFSNDSYWSLRDLTFNCYLWNVEDANHNSIGYVMSHNYIPPTPNLEAGDKQTIPCTTHFRTYAQIIKADIQITAQYHLFLVPKIQTKTYRFVLAIGSDRRYHWFRQPIHSDS